MQLPPTTMSGQPARTHEDIEAQITAIQAKRAQQGDQEDVPKENERIGLTETGVFDQDIYGGKGKFEGYVTSIASKEDEEDDEEAAAPEKGKRMPNYTAPQAVLKDMEKGQEDDYDPFAEHKIPTIASRDSEYTRRRLQQQISPARVDFFADGGKTPDAGGRGYAEIMREQELKGTEAEYRKQMAEKAKDGTLKPVDTNGAAKAAPKRRGRWDQTEETPAKTAKKPASSFFQAEGSATPGGPADATPGRQAWAETPGRVAPGSETPGTVDRGRMWDPTPAHTTPGRDKSSETPGHAGSATPGGASSRRNRWDETPRTDRETTGEIFLHLHSTVVFTNARQ